MGPALTGGPGSGGAGSRDTGDRPPTVAAARTGGDRTIGAGAVGGTDRTRVRRLPDLAVPDRPTLHAVLDAGRVGHLAIVDGDQPYALPVAYARDGDRVLAYGIPQPDPRLRHDLPPPEW